MYNQCYKILKIIKAFNCMGKVWTMSLSLLSISTIFLLFIIIGESPSFVPYKCQIQQKKPYFFMNSVEDNLVLVGSRMMVARVIKWTESTTIFTTTNAKTIWVNSQSRMHSIYKKRGMNVDGYRTWNKIFNEIQQRI